jgi:hypothetical protein
LDRKYKSNQAPRQKRKSNQVQNKKIKRQSDPCSSPAGETPARRQRRRGDPPPRVGGRCLHAPAAAASTRRLPAVRARGRCLHGSPSYSSCAGRETRRVDSSWRRRGEALAARDEALARGESLAALLMAGCLHASIRSWRRRFELAGVDSSWLRRRPALRKRRPALAEEAEAGIDGQGGGRQRRRSSYTRERVERGGNEGGEV